MTIKKAATSALLLAAMVCGYPAMAQDAGTPENGSFGVVAAGWCPVYVHRRRGRGALRQRHGVNMGQLAPALGTTVGF